MADFEARKLGIRTLLKGIENGSPESVEVIHPDRYVQHNPQTQENREGLAALFARLSKSNPSVNIVRLFTDGDYVFGHTEYDFASRRIGFEVFKFNETHAVEHWDNIQPRRAPNASNHSMVDGPTEARDIEFTEENRRTVTDFVLTVLLASEPSRASSFVGSDFVDHESSSVGDGVEAFQTWLEKSPLRYLVSHRILAQGDFVLSVCECARTDDAIDDTWSSYDLFRLAKGKIVERWNTSEKVPPLEEWKNTNGKF